MIATDHQFIYPYYVSRQSLDLFISRALEEDIGSGDYSSLASIKCDMQKKAHLIIKQPGILAGVNMAREIFSYLDADLVFESLLQDGDVVNAGQIAFTISGQAQNILSAERVVLNCMQRMSGIATQTHHYTQLISHTKALLLDTRKTTPGFRMPEKWAVYIGGGHNHRFGLYDMIMLKDNHIDYAGGVKPALDACMDYLNQHELQLFIVVEARTLAEVEQAAAYPVSKRILLDNMNPTQLEEAVRLVAGRCQTEASGGVNADTIARIAQTGVDFISVGALTHSAPCLDMSLKAY